MARSRFRFDPDLNNRAKRRIFEETFGAEIDADGDQSEAEHIRACRAEINDPECPENTRGAMLDYLGYARGLIAAAKTSGVDSDVYRFRRNFDDCREQLRRPRFTPMPLP